VGKQWLFKNWSGDVTGSTSPASVTMSAARSVTANYGAQYQLTLAVTAGVPGALSNITGGANASFYDSGTVLSLSATAGPITDGVGKQWVFKNWSGDATGGTSPASVTMSAPHSVTANYGAQYQLTLAITAGVPGTLANITGGTNGAFYDDTTVLTLAAATPVADGAGKQWAFKNWTGSATGSTSPVSVTMSAPRLVTANYGVQWQLTLAVTTGVPSGSSNITGGNNGTFYDDGTLLHLSAMTPVADGAGKRWVFQNWSGDVTGSTSPVSVTMSAPHTVTANYGAQYQLTLAITAGVTNGLANISGGTNGTFYDAGTGLTLTATASVAPAYTFKNWTGDVASSPNTSNPVSVTMSAPRSVSANYTTWGLAWASGLAFRAQYSDPTLLAAVLTADGLPVSGKTINFAVGTDNGSGTTDVSGTATDSAKLTQAPGTGYTASAQCPVAQCGVQLATTHPYEITQEDARAYYTGDLFIGIPLTSTSATVNLSATIKDITAVSGDTAFDSTPGDIRNAKVAFVMHDGTGGTINLGTCTGLTPILVNSTDPKVGVVSCTAPVSNVNPSATFGISTVVTGYYTDNISTEDVIVTVSQVGTGMITGGGFVVLDQTATGSLLPALGSKNNFGFNVKYNKSGTNLQGNINTIVRSTSGKVYQIKGNQMATLGVSQLVGGKWVAGCANGATTTSPCQATFTGKANIQDVTNPNALPLPVDGTGGSTLYAVMTDYGTGNTGSTFVDSIAFTVTGSSGTWFSTTTAGSQKLIAGGNLVVH
jgi:hypothetical protein